MCDRRLRRRMATKEEIFEKIRDVLVEEFDINKDEVTMDAELVGDLDLDSIDAAELIVKFRDYLPPKVDATVFRELVTVGDLVEYFCKNA